MTFHFKIEKTVKNLLFVILIILNCSEEKFGIKNKVGPWPLTGTEETDLVLFPFGPSTVNGAYQFLEGVYLRTRPDQPIFATESGVVLASLTELSEREDLERILVIGHEPYNHIQPMHSIYGNLSAFAVKKGDYVKKGEIIGFTSLESTGLQSLYFALRRNSGSDVFTSGFSAHPMKLIGCESTIPEVRLTKVDDTLVQLYMEQSGPCLDVVGFEVISWKKDRAKSDYEVQIGFNRNQLGNSEHGRFSYLPDFDVDNQTWKLTVDIKGVWTEQTVDVILWRGEEYSEYTFSL